MNPIHTTPASRAARAGEEDPGNGKGRDERGSRDAREYGEHRERAVPADGAPTRAGEFKSLSYA